MIALRNSFLTLVVHNFFPGIRDLKAGIIRTPLPPKETFLDDPLRVLRAVRFGELGDFLQQISLCDPVIASSSWLPLIYENL